MAEVLLTQAVNQAEEAIESGNYGGAIEACQRILGHFPEFAGAHRIMGDAYAEQGEHEAAREAYQRTLERDPQSIPAHLGFGMLAEDAGDQETALAYFQVAWEIDPRRRDLREHVSRISQQLYGADGRLYLTRAALASLHFHAGRWDRAVSESAQVLQEFSSRIDIQVRLAEALWRRGDDQQARQVCTTVLRSLPQAVVPLLMLADIHRREGDNAGSDDFLKQARDIDPDGVRAADLMMVGFDDQADFLSVESIPTIDDQVVLEEPARYAPAPDFTAADAEDIPPAAAAPQEDVVIPEQQRGAPDLSGIEPSGVQPFRWEDVGDEDLEMSDLDGQLPEIHPSAAHVTGFDDFSLPTDEELEQARPGEERPAGYTGMIDSLDSEGMEPFDPMGGSGQTSQQSTTEPHPEFDWDSLAMPTDEDLDRARPKSDQLSGYTNMLDSLDSAGVQPFDPFGDEQPAQAAQPPVEDELAPGIDEIRAGESADSDDWLSEFSLPSEEEIERARPEETRPPGFTGMLDSLEAEGIQPFDPTASTSTGEQVPESESSTPTEPVESEIADATEEPADFALDLDELHQESPFELDWSNIDEEIEEARPGDMPGGYTDQLRALDDVGVEPFAFDDRPEADAEQPEAVLSEQGGGESDAGEDELSDEWEEVARETDELKPLPEDRRDQFEEVPVDILFEGEDDQHFAETEPLRSELLDDLDPFGLVSEPDTEVDLASAAERGESWEADGGLEDLIAEADSLGSGWSAASGEGIEEDSGEPSSSLSGSDERDPVASAAADVSRESSEGPQTVGISISAERLGLDEALIDRARHAKQALIESGRISGNKPLVEKQDVSAEALRELVEADPLNIDHRIALGSSLVSSEPDEALEQFRWIYRNAPDRGADIVPDLARLIVVMREREVGVHRLLGALYRRGGDWAAASRHYEESLLGKRRIDSK
jgi:tetratricopeptide (TPR) repeat protein